MVDTIEKTQQNAIDDLRNEMLSKIRESEKEIKDLKKRIDELQDSRLRPNLLSGSSECYEIQEHHAEESSFRTSNEMSVINIEVPVEPSSKRQAKSSLASRLYGIPQDDMEQVPTNTNSFHMYAVYIVTATDPKKSHWFRALTMAFVSLVLVMTEVSICQILIRDAAFPDCTTHTDCRDGEYCNISGKRATCRDCDYDKIWKTEKHNDAFCSDVFTGKDLDVVEPNQEWWYLDQSKKFDELSDEYMCSARLQCDNDIFPKTCDFLKLSMPSWGGSQLIVLVFIAIMIANPLSKDMIDARREEQLLDRGWKFSIRKNRSKLGCAEFLVRVVALEIVRVSLCVRRIVLPCAAIGATVAVIVADKVTTQSILLDSLSVSFLFGADDELYQLLLPSYVEEAVDTFVEETVEEAQNDDFYFKSSFLFSRVLSIVLSVVMALVIWFFDQILRGEILPKIFMQKNCDGIMGLLTRLVEYLVYSVYILLILNNAFTGCINRGLTKILFDISVIITAHFLFQTVFSWITDFDVLELVDLPFNGEKNLHYITLVFFGMQTVRSFYLCNKN